MYGIGSGGGVVRNRQKSIKWSIRCKQHKTSLDFTSSSAILNHGRTTITIALTLNRCATLLDIFVFVKSIIVFILRIQQCLFCSLALFRSVPLTVTRHGSIRAEDCGTAYPKSALRNGRAKSICRSSYRVCPSCLIEPSKLTSSCTVALPCSLTWRI